ncbi:MAG TPA: hypothetical protein VFZ09_47670 [Archangium sp.]|uniref:hypothetical protein n=1 Tax=Archangium sp. TaxID=1872627 RepID=UPI002E37C405|nr:hypothetical protein [Archangium sp.]HEX5753956.1 hypothetical protein [Archangium sp.]
MNRVKKASWWAVVLAGGLMMALPAVAQQKKDCRGSCLSKASVEVEACAKACPAASDPTTREAAGKCMNRCAEKFRAAEASCEKTCPAPKQEDQTH